MKVSVSAIVLAAALFTGAASAQAAKLQSKTIVVERPSQLPELAQIDGEAIYLHNTGDDQAILYIETNKGRTLAILNVSDPARVHDVAQVAINAPAPYDFVQSVGDSAALIHYRNDSGFAVVDFKKYQHPTLVQTSQLAEAGNIEELGAKGLLFTSATGADTSFDPAPQTYGVVDTSNPSNPVALASIDGVVQRLSRPETGTLFLLSSQGVTIVRRPRMEEEYAIGQMQMESN